MSGFYEKLSDSLKRKTWGDNLLDSPKSEVAELAIPSNSSDLMLGMATGEDEDGNEVALPKGVQQDARTRHAYVVGSTGSGKTKFLETLMLQDIEQGHGFGVIDPHGDLADEVLSFLCEMKGKEFLINEVVLIDPSDEVQTVTFNPLQGYGNESSASVASGLVEAFKKIWSDSWGPRMEDLLKNSLIALIENYLTLGELPLLLTDSVAREEIVNNIKHPICKQYFARFNSLPEKTRNEWIESTMNKVNAFLSDDRVRQMLVCEESSFDARDVMDSGKVLVVKLDKGRMKGNADLLGSLLLASLQAAAFSRTDMKKEDRETFHLYIDEFQNFATESFVSMLAESRKYGLALTLAHQNLAQLTDNLRASILGNCGLQIYFRVSREDAELLARESMVPIYSKELGWESFTQGLQSLPPRVFAACNRIEHGVIIARSLDVPGLESPNPELLRVLGIRYKWSRKQIEAEYTERTKNLTRDEELEEPESFGEQVIQ